MNKPGKRMKRQPTDWEKVFTNQISDKRPLVSKIKNSRN